jgi:hypothetical protein
MSDQALVKVQESLIAEIAPFEQQSKALKEKALAQVVTNESQLASAVNVKKQITAHRKLVTDTRLGFTRQFDEVKRAVMTKEAEILLPLDEGQTALSQTILTYTEEQDRIKREEAERVEKIVARLTAGDVYRLKTPEDVSEEGARLKKVFSELKPADQDIPAVKVAFTRSVNQLADRRTHLEEQIEQAKQRAELEAKAKEQSAAQAKIDADRAANEAKARKIKADQERMEREKQRKAEEDAAEEARKKAESDERHRVKTGARTVTNIEITEPWLVPREFCEPSEKLIRAAIKEGATVPGVKVMVEKKV